MPRSKTRIVITITSIEVYLCFRHCHHDHGIGGRGTLHVKHTSTPLQACYYCFMASMTTVIAFSTPRASFHTHSKMGLLLSVHVEAVATWGWAGTLGSVVGSEMSTLMMYSLPMPLSRQCLMQFASMQIELWLVGLAMVRWWPKSLVVTRHRCFVPFFRWVGWCKCVLVMQLVCRHAVRLYNTTLVTPLGQVYWWYTVMPITKCHEMAITELAFLPWRTTYTVELNGVAVHIIHRQTQSTPPNLSTPFTMIVLLILYNTHHAKRQVKKIKNNNKRKLTQLSKTSILNKIRYKKLSLHSLPLLLTMQMSRVKSR